MNLIAKFIGRHLTNEPNLVKIVNNIGWLFFDKILRMGIGFFLGVWIARYLGPEQFGLFNYANAYVALFGAIATCGLNGIVVKDLVILPKNANVTLGTAFVLQFISGLVALLLIVGSIAWIRPDDDLCKAMVAIFGVSLVFQSSVVIKYWFESQVQSRYAVWVENGLFLVVALIKIGMIHIQAPLIAFVWVVLFEAILVAIGLFFLYIWKTEGLKYWSVSLKRAKSLLSDSWPLVLSSISIMIYMRIDQIMLGEIVGAEAVGIYSAALRISEVWYIIPIIIVASIFPMIIKSKKNNEALYKNRIQNLLNFMTTLAVVIAVSVTLIANLLIVTLYGKQYDNAAQILIIHIWACPFIFAGVVGSSWYLVENLQRLIFYRTATGAILNIILNFILIPIYGPSGAAFATVISQVLASYILDAFSTKSYPMFVMKTKALFFGLPLVLIELIKKTKLK